MKGRLCYRRDGLSVFIQEPDPSLMYESMMVYEEAYDQAYYKGLYLKDEIPELLFDLDLYSPFDDQDITKIKREIEDLKVQAFENYNKFRELKTIKFSIRQKEDILNRIYKKRYQFDHLTCEGYATFSQWNWIIENSTYFETGEPYDWSSLTISQVLSYYESSSITSEEYRIIARSDLWRPIWVLGKKTGNLFDRSSSMLSKDQITLCSFSMMYDNVYESPESPHDNVIEDDDCLDGWFIHQKRKHKKAKKENEVNKLLSSNSKIANAKEVFIVANNREEAEEIESLNSSQSKATKKQRFDMLKQKGEIKTDLEFTDVKRDVAMQQNRDMVSKLTGD
jgi:hypothetical protein